LGVYARGGLDDSCASSGRGPQPVAALPQSGAGADFTPLGVSGLGGNIGEWNLDSMRDYRDPCWFVHTLHDVGCSEDEPPDRSTRGGAWPTGVFQMRAAMPSSLSTGVGDMLVGFRCVAKGTP
jgi:formylglycine-generating enzyme required for sulfatase activity